MPYAWLLGAIGLHLVEAGYGAVDGGEDGALPLPGCDEAFAIYLLYAEQARRAARGPGDLAVEARRRMHQTSEPAFQRYLKRVRSWWTWRGRGPSTLLGRPLLRR